MNEGSEQVSPVSRRTRQRQNSQSSDVTITSNSELLDAPQLRRSQRRRNPSNQSSPGSTANMSETDGESVKSASTRATRRSVNQTPVQTGLSVSGDELQTSRSSRTRRTPTQLLRSGGRLRSRNTTPDKNSNSKLTTAVPDEELPVITEVGEELTESNSNRTSRSTRSRRTQLPHASDSEVEMSAADRSRSPRKPDIAGDDSVPQRRSRTRQTVQPQIIEFTDIQLKRQTRRSTAKAIGNMADDTSEQVKLSVNISSAQIYASTSAYHVF